MNFYKNEAEGLKNEGIQLICRNRRGKHKKGRRVTGLCFLPRSADDRQVIHPHDPNPLTKFLTHPRNTPSQYSLLIHPRNTQPIDKPCHNLLQSSTHILSPPHSTSLSPPIHTPSHSSSGTPSPILSHHILTSSLSHPPTHSHTINRACIPVPPCS